MVMTLMNAGHAVHSLDITAQGSIAGVHLQGISHGSDAGMDEPTCTALADGMILMNAGHAMLLAAPAEVPQACMMPCCLIHQVAATSMPVLLCWRPATAAAP